MNIAYILNATVLTGGATKAFLNMLEGMMKYGVKPYVVVPDNKGVYIELQKRQIPTLSVTYRSSVYPPTYTMKQRLLFVVKLTARIIANRRATNVLTRWIKENDIDIVHSNSSVIRIGFDAAQRTGTPHIYHLREYRQELGLKYYPTEASFLRQLQAQSSYNICITKGIQSFYGQNTNADSRVIYDGVFHKKESMPTADSKDYFLYAGRIQQPKGLDQLLKAYAIYASQQAKPLKLKVAGGNDGDTYYSQQLAFISDHQLTEQVELLGECKNIAPLMCNARALIIPSISEGFGFCMPEAMQQGTLCIAHNTTGTKEQLDNALELTGKEIALRYDTIEQMAELLTEAASNPPSHYEDMTRRAFIVVNELYTKDMHAQRVYGFYQDILKKTDKTA